MSVVTFETEGLLWKWGFGDGDMLDDLLAGHGWADQWQKDREAGIDIWFDHRVLVRVIREHVLPALAEHHVIATMVVDTIHNPIRATVVDGVEVDSIRNGNGIKLTPAKVDVPESVILRIATEEAR